MTRPEPRNECSDSVDMPAQGRPASWTPDQAQACLRAALADRGGRARVHGGDAPLLNRASDEGGPGPRLAACESCGAVFESAYARAGYFCSACVRERADRRKPGRRRADTAWWRDDPGPGACLACVNLPTAAQRSDPLWHPRPPRPGSHYCSPACLRRTRRFVEAGGVIAPGGVPLVW